MNSFITLAHVAMCLVLVNAQMVPPMGGMPGMGLPLPQGQMQHLWQQFFTYRLLYGDAAARIIMASQLASQLGNSPFAKYYAGEFFDTPDAWWLTSTLFNTNQAGGAGLI